MPTPTFFKNPILNSPYEYPKRFWETDADKCHVNYAVCDSDWERMVCEILGISGVHTEPHSRKCPTVD